MPGEDFERAVRTEFELSHRRLLVDQAVSLAAALHRLATPNRSRPATGADAQRMADYAAEALEAVRGMR